MKKKEKIRIYIPKKERIRQIQQQIAVINRVLISA